MKELKGLFKQLDDSRQTQIAVKKSIIQYFQDKNRSQAETLEKLNLALEAWNKKTVTIGCVKHHWKQPIEQQI
ncbi:hypothetical protein POL82_04280 [Priestia aryabhattai]|uniref:hypothetical protein n=1 Tax=Priestia TaxID=2800373 RepID=UPI00234F5C27|nr:MULTISPECIES: hypothetical protein [Priestia]MDC7762666.1 hypothetical protein [Priestia aryabhattai]MED3980878.1 hypothetical protein [Priestia megaterium]